MGCDIHLYKEKFVKNKWQFIEEIDGNRDYDTFSLLCGVRNYYRPTPITKSTSVPSDLSNKVLNIYENWESDAHTFCILTKKDLDNYKDWNTPFIDTRTPKPIDPLETKFGGISDFEEKYHNTKIDPELYNSVTPTNILKDSGYDILFKELKDNERLIFWFDN